MLQKAINLLPQVQFDTPNEDSYRLSALRWRVAAPQSFVTTYAGWNISRPEILLCCGSRKWKTSQRWRKVTMTELEQRQLELLRKDLELPLYH